jgi:mRNA deadenylase 3'-5' endonuclease subunit Ccr4
MVINEIMQYSPDIACFQECENWYDFILPDMERHGYIGIIKVAENRRTLL